MSDGTNIFEPVNGVEQETAIDTHEVDFGNGDVRDRQRVSLAGTAANSDVATATSDPSNGEVGLVVRPAGKTKVQMLDENGTLISEANPLPVSVGDLTINQLTVTFPDSEVSTVNSRTTPLAANEVWLGDWELVTKYAAISAIVLTDQNSAVNGAIVQFSEDALDGPVRSISATIPANAGLTFMFAPEAKYFRIQYTNGPVAQTVFRTQIILHYQPPTAPQLPLAATTTDVSLAQSTISHLKGRQSSGAYIPLRADSTGRLEVVQEVPSHVVVDNSNLPVTVDAGTQALLQSLVDHEIALGQSDANNALTRGLDANETFTGNWTEFGTVGGINTLLLFNQQLVSASIEWSSDGVNKDTSLLGTTPLLLQQSSTFSTGHTSTYISNIPINKYYRIKVVNGPTASTTGFIRMWRLRAPFGGSYSTLAATPTNFSVGLLTRAIQSGFAPDGTFQNIPVGGHDPLNSTTTLIGGNGTYTGAYKASAGLSSMLVFGLTDQPLTTARIQWSHDGTTPSVGVVGTSDLLSTVQVFDNPAAGPGAKVYIYLSVITTIIDKFYRLELANGATANTLYSQFDVWVYDKPFTGSYGSLTGNLSSISTALLTRAVNAGTLPDGTFKNVIYGGVDPKQSPHLQTTPVLLAPNQDYTAPWVNVEGFADVSALVLTDVDGIAHFDYSMDGVTQDRTANYPIAGGVNSDWISAAPRGKYFRFRFTNGPNTQTVFKAQIAYSTTPVGNQFGRMATAPTDETIVATTKTVIAGRRPDGSYVNSPETGVSALNNTTTPLSANNTWTGQWELCDQYSAIAVNVRADVGGAPNAITMDFSQDATAVDRTASFSYMQFPAGATFAVPVQARYFRISYLNGGTAQTVFRLQTRLIEESLDGATAPLNEGITDATMAQVNRSIVSGKAPNGNYTNVVVSNTGAMRTDPEALPNFLFGSYTVGTSASQLVTSNFQNRRTVSFKTDPGNSGIVYIGSSNAVTTSTGYPLNPGDAIDIDAQTGVLFWAVGSKSNQRVATLETGSS